MAKQFRNYDVILGEALEKTERNLFIDLDTINMDRIHELATAGIYDPMVTFEVIRSELFSGSIEYIPGPVSQRQMTKQEKKEFIEKLDNRLTSIPVKYEIFFRLPHGYPNDDREIAKGLSIVTPSSELANQYTKTNPDLIPILDAPSVSSITSSVAPKVDAKYLVIVDEGVATPTNKIFLGRNDPIRIFKLYIALQKARGCLAFDVAAMRHPTNVVSSIFEKGNYKFVANMPNPLSSSDMDNQGFMSVRAPKIKELDDNFPTLLKDYSDPRINEERIKLTNSLYWYFEYERSPETSLKVVYLVSAFDSLFGIEDNNKPPTVRDIAPVIVDANALEFSDRKELMEGMRALYKKRNGIIHGSTEVQNYRHEDQADHERLLRLAWQCVSSYRTYVNKRFDQFIKTVKRKKLC